VIGLRRVLDALYGGAAALAMLLLVAIACLVVAQMASRLFLVVLPGIDDFAGYCLAAATFLGLAPTFKAGAHIRVTMLGYFVGPRVVHWLDLAVLVVGIVFTAYFTWAAIDFVKDSYEFNEIATAMVRTPLWIPRIAIPVGLAVLLIALVDELVRVARGGRLGGEAA
jgi:TRAP-type C4-dicarboxylate transport system permease small subunit